MNNFFLLHEALNPPTIADFENGVRQLTVAVANKDKDTDNLIRHQDFWNYQTVHGFCYDLPNRLQKELVGLTYKLFESFTSISNYIPNEKVFDSVYINDCNGFKGFDFSVTAIHPQRQITDLNSFERFKDNCLKQNCYGSIQKFWDARDVLFSNLVFCDRVKDQIEHLSTEDDRFRLIDDKLKRLNHFTGNWKGGPFDFKKLGLENSPDTPKRVADTLSLRTFECPVIGSRVFTLHIKWYCGGEPFRLYYYPFDGKVYIGYIGPKDEIGF